MEEPGISLGRILTILGGMFAVRWILFTAVIWGLLRIQSLNYRWPGLLLTTALGSVAYFIPVGFIAAAAAFVVVYIGLKMVTQAEHTDLMFSIVISNAIMYVTSLWLIAAVLPDVRRLREAAANTNEEREKSFMPDYAGMMSKASNTFVKGTMRGEATGASATGAGPVSSSAKVAGLKLKGITMMSSGGLAMIQAGDKTVSVGVKESVTVPGPKGVIRYACQSITTNQVTLLLQGSKPPRTVELKLE